MAFDQPFTEKIITQFRKGTPDDPFLDIREIVTVSGGTALLTEIPYKYNRVKILEQVAKGNGDVNDVLDGGSFSNASPISASTDSTVFYEIPYGSGTPSDSQFYVNYGDGTLTFNPSQEGSTFLVEYKGRGFTSIPVSKVYTKLNGSQVVETLDDITSTLPDLNTAISNANQATVNANNATANFQTILDEQLLIYKGSVSTYADIATTFPTPELGWMVVALDTGIRWRWDGVQWMNIGYDEISGFRVLVSPNPPINTNSLWVSTPVGTVTKNARVIKSSTAPSDTSVIWWQTI